MSDDIIPTVEFREQTKVALASLNEHLGSLAQSFSEFKNSQLARMDVKAQRLNAHDDRLARIETSVAMLVRVTWVIVGCTVGMVMTAIFKQILR